MTEVGLLPLHPYNPRKRLALTHGSRLGPSEVTAQIGEGGSASVRGSVRTPELRRDLAVAKTRTR